MQNKVNNLSVNSILVNSVMYFLKTNLSLVYIGKGNG